MRIPNTEIEVAKDRLINIIINLPIQLKIKKLITQDKTWMISKELKEK